MSANDEDMLRYGVNITDAEDRSHGTYRTFSKDGSGYSFVRYAGEVLFNGYACYPSVATPEEGVEYFISTRVSIPKDTTVTEAMKIMTAGMASVNEAIYSGALP